VRGLRPNQFELQPIRAAAWLEDHATKLAEVPECGSPALRATFANTADGCASGGVAICGRRGSLTRGVWPGTILDGRSSSFRSGFSVAPHSPRQGPENSASSRRLLAAEGSKKFFTYPQAYTGFPRKNFLKTFPSRAALDVARLGAVGRLHSETLAFDCLLVWVCLGFVVEWLYRMLETGVSRCRLAVNDPAISRENYSNNLQKFLQIYPFLP
jgi:hypothetical protein